MKCPYCDEPDTKVIDSRPSEEGRAIRRRRECPACGKRFTTYEKVEEMLLMVVKRDGRRESFDRNKILNGIIRACEKRPVSRAQMEAIVDDVERGLNNMMEKEVSTQFIGVGTFIAEIEKLLGSNSAEKKKIKKLAEAEK